jgi:uncharacterized protein (DUF1330 family)
VDAQAAADLASAPDKDSNTNEQHEDTPMAAYVIFLRESPIHTPAEMEKYMSGDTPIDPKMKVLAVYGPQTPLEGQAPDGVAMLEFPTVEDAKAWYYGPYHAKAQHRQAAAEYRGFIVEGFTPPV